MNAGERGVQFSRRRVGRAVECGGLEILPVPSRPIIPRNPAPGLPYGGRPAPGPGRPPRTALSRLVRLQIGLQMGFSRTKPHSLATIRRALDRAGLLAVAK